MQEVVLKQGGEVAVFEPNQSGIKIAALDAARKYAQKARDWDALANAVDEQIDVQKALVGWWADNVQQPGGDGSNQHAKSNSPRTALIAVSKAEEETQLSQQQVSRWRNSLKTPEAEEKYRQRLYGRAYQAAMGVTHGTQGTGENEWYTPEKYIEAARYVLGTIELDPASSEKAQETIQASRYFTVEDNGLERPWKAETVFLNPPYSQPQILHFVDKLVAELTARNVIRAILLTHNSTDTAWFHRAEGIAASICFTRGRISFVDPAGVRCAPTQGQAFFYFGDKSDYFKKVFSDFGFVR